MRRVYTTHRKVGRHWEGMVVYDNEGEGFDTGHGPYSALTERGIARKLGRKAKRARRREDGL